MFRVRLEQSFKPEPFHFLIQTHQAKQYFYAHSKRTSNLGTINSRELKNWPVAIPTVAEQGTMIEIFEAAESEYAAIESKVIALKDVKRSLLQNLLAGTIRLPQSFSASP
jgi:type I restriction enzyme, S subunit